MTSPSKPQNTMSEKQVVERMTQALDASVDNLSDNAKSDLMAARHAALRAARQTDTKPGWAAQIGQWLAMPTTKAAVPVAAAVLIALSLTYETAQPVPALPVAMVDGDVPTEDLALLEDLDFVTWLAENEPDALL